MMPEEEIRVTVARVPEPLVVVDRAPRPLVRRDDVERRAEPGASLHLRGEDAAFRSEADPRLSLERPSAEYVLHEQVVALIRLTRGTPGSSFPSAMNSLASTTISEPSTTPKLRTSAGATR